MQYSSFYLHPAQQEVYTDQLLNPDSPQYNIGGYLKLKGNLDKDKFHEAVRSAALVFEAFRMRFDLDAADFLCYLDEEFTTSEIVDIDFSSFPCPEAEATQWMQQRFNTPLSLQKQSIPFEQFLLKIHEDEYWFFGKYHHLITDGYGFIVFVQYLADKYQSLINNNDLSFSFPSYKQEAIKAAEYKESVDYKEAGKYWHEKLNTPPAKLLSKKYPRDNSGKKSRTYVHLLTPRQTKLLQEIQSVSKLGLLQLTTAALLIYFGKTSGQTEFVFGIPVHKRRKLFRNIVGMFSGILPFKANYHQDAKLSDVLKSIAHLQKEDYRHQHYLLGDIIRDLQVNPSKDELFEIILNYEPFNFYLDFGAGIQSSIYQLTSEYGRNPLEFCWQNYGDQQPLQLLINYQNEYFIREEIELLAQRIIYILEQFPLLLHGKVADFNILPDSELHLLHQFGTSQVNYPRDKTIVSLFEEQVKYSPHNTAVVFEQQLMTYQQLNERSNQLGRYLQKRGVREETLVPVCVERSAEMIIAILAILKAGGAYVPIDPEYPEDRIKFLLQDTGATIIISSKEIDLKKVAEGIDIINVESVDVINEAKENLQVNVKPESLAYVIYTSGSTGKPKGVMIEHRALVDHCFGVIESAHLRTCTSFALFSPLVFDAGHSIIHSAFVLGASLHVLSSQLLMDGEKVIEYLDNNVIDCIKIVPSLWLSYADGSKMALARKVMLFGGEAFPHTILDRLMQVNYNGEIYNHYGPTETTIGKCIHKINLKKHYNIVPIGKPFSNTQLYIIDHHFNLVPIGVTGDLHIGGEGIARGYLNRPELTAEKFISHPFNNKEARVYKTGDLCRWLPDGDIEYLGRIDDQVKIRGYRIELGEIESVLLQSGLLKQAVVLAKEDTNTTKRLVGYVVPEGVFNRDAITTYAKSMLPEYMVPAQWIELDSIPMTVNGKIDKKALPEPDFIELKRDNYEAPRNQLEETLTVIWKELLGVERISINDNFFDLGGHSLKAIQLTSRLHKLLNIKTDIAKVISNPTIKQLGQVLLFEKQNQFLQIKPLPEEEHYALSHAQKRIWVLSQFKDGSLAYTGSGTYIIEGSLDIRAFKEAFDAVIERHESLRTIFIEVNNEPRQKILSPSELEFRIEELDLRKNPDREVILNQRLEKDKSLVFDLTKGPLLRAILYRVEDEKYIFSFNIHHIISDGWSKGILIKDFFQAYKNLINGPDRNYVPLTIQYKDYAAWHQALFVNQGSFWREVYQEGIPTLNFPLDFERPKVLSFSGAIVQHSLPEEVTLRLQKIAVEQGMTLNNLMLALYGLLVSHYSQQDEVIIGSLTSGRSHVDLENLIGVFINFLPIRISTKKDLLLAEYLNHCQQFLTQAYSNQDYPFDLMVGDCIKQRDVSRNPFFDTMVNFHNENNLHNGGQLSEGQMTGTGISIKPLPLSDKELYQSVLDFKLDVELINNSLNLKLSYNTKLFREERMRVFLTQYVELLELVINEPDRELQEYLKWEVEKPNIVINQEAQSTSTELVFSVNICASFVIEPVQEYIEYWSKEYELHAKVAFAPYNQIFQQLLDTQSLINSSTKGLNVLFIRLDDWLRNQLHLSSSEQIEVLNQAYSQLIKAIEHSCNITNVPFLIGIVPLYSNLSFTSEVANHVQELNNKLELSLQEHPSVSLINLNEIASLYDIDEVYDARSDKVGHMPFSPEYYAAIGTFIARKLRAYKGPSYKVIALDCDNTLWKGICGEVGATGVVLDENFTYLQEFLLNKLHDGFLLALCSKNNEEDVWEVLNRNPMPIKRDHIAAYRINWDPKPDNLLAISKELNLGLDSFVFIDDSEFEVEQMALSFPEVLSLTLPNDPNEFAGFLKHIWAFDTFKITEEDRQRNLMYKAEKQRREEQVKHGSLTDFLQSLNITVNIRPLEEKDLDRAVQLCLRTNQFNLNGIRRTREEITKSIREQNKLNWIIEVKDRFGDYGIVGLLLAKKAQNVLLLETFLLSCRVLGREVENKVLSELQNHCIVHGLNTITALFQPTSRNKPFIHFLEHTGWKVDQETSKYTFLI